MENGSQKTSGNGTAGELQMTFTIDNVIKSIAAFIARTFTDGDGKAIYKVYDNVNQQGTEFPCFFIFLMPSGIEDQVDERQIRTLAFDLVFVQQRNITDGRTQINRIVEELDFGMDPLPYLSNGETVPLHLSGREVSIEDDEMHYKFTIKARVSKPKAENPMNQMEETNVEVRE